jgi:hypothetical protein
LETKKQYTLPKIKITWKQIPLHIAWAKTVHSDQAHNTGPTPANQTPNAIQIISIHLGDIKYEALNHGLTYMVVSTATTIGCLGHMEKIPRKYMNSAIYFLRETFPSGIKCLGRMETIPRKCMNSAIYFLRETFPSGIKCLTRAYSNKEQYIRVKKRSIWIVYLDKQKNKTKNVSDSSARKS